MPFASINSTNPRTNPLNFCKIFLRIGYFNKLSFFESAILDFFFQFFFCVSSPKKSVKLLGYQGLVKILMITLVVLNQLKNC